MAGLESRLTLVRHGETDWNKGHRWQGHIDIPLNAAGKEQAGAVAKFLSRESIDVIYASDLQRAHQTATAIGKLHNLQVMTDSRLREIAFGEWEGLTADDIDARHGAGTHEAFLADRLHKIPPKGETVEALFNRVSEFINETPLKHRNQSVVVVSHGGALRAILSLLLTEGKTAWPRLELGNCSVSRAVLRGTNRPVVKVIGENHFLVNSLVGH